MQEAFLQDLIFAPSNNRSFRNKLYCSELRTTSENYVTATASHIKGEKVIKFKDLANVYTILIDIFNAFVTLNRDILQDQTL